jgi:mannose-6-phosphate isomerase-like protein (cupin superfamily)
MQAAYDILLSMSYHECMNIQDGHPNDAINIAPQLHRVMYEDDKMRVLKVSVRPGDKAAMHWHPHNINYVLSAGTLRFNKPDGTTVDVQLAEGQITSSTAESLHAVENIGEGLVETIQVELKG